MTEMQSNRQDYLTHTLLIVDQLISQIVLIITLAAVSNFYFLQMLIFI